jgi:hypothetical protein
MFFIVSQFLIGSDAINKLFLVVGCREMACRNKGRTFWEKAFLLHTMSSRQEARGREFAVWVTSQRTSSEKDRTRKRFEETAKRTRNIRWLVTIDEKAKALANTRGTDVSELLAQLVHEECARREEE